MVSFLEKDRHAVDLHSVEDGHDAHVVANDTGHNLVREVVVDRVLHVCRQELVSETFMIHLLIIEYFDEHLEHSLILVSVESYFEHLLIVKMVKLRVLG